MPTPNWFVKVVRVTSRDKQQQILSHFQAVIGPTAMGASSGGDYVVVLGCFDSPMKSAAEELISDIAPDAHCNDISGSRPPNRPTPWQIPEAASASPN